VGARNLEQAAQGGAIQVVGEGDLGVAEQYPRTVQQMLGVGELAAVVEAEVDVVAMDGDGAEVLRHLAGADAEADDPPPGPGHLDDGGKDVADEDAGAAREIGQRRLDL
jgi:hypothetical protein